MPHSASPAARKMNDWRRGKPAREETVDSYFTDLGIHLNELPEWMWLPQKMVCAPPPLEEIREAVLMSLRNGGYPRQCALRWGLSREQVDRWAREVGIIIVTSLYDDEKRKVTA
jgi:hypothetical protein